MRGEKVISKYDTLTGTTEGESFDCASILLDLGPRSIDTDRGVIVGGIREVRITVEDGRIVLYCPEGQLDVRPVVQNVVSVGVIS